MWTISVPIEEFVMSLDKEIKSLKGEVEKLKKDLDDERQDRKTADRIIRTSIGV